MDRRTAASCILAAALVLVALSAQAAEPIKIGVTAPLTGPKAESGRYQIQAANLAVDEINKAGGVLGRPLELVIEDDQSTNPGIVLAFSKLAGNSEFVAFLASIRSTQLHAMAPDALKLGKPVLIGGTDPVLTHMGNPWYFRFRPNDTYSARVIADYGTKTLGKKKWAIVHSTDAFGTSGMKLLVVALKGMGIEPVLIQGYPNFSQDFTAVALAVKQSGADVMGTYMFEADQAIFAKQLRQLGVTPTWVGSPTTVSVMALKLAGRRSTAPMRSPTSTGIRARRPRHSQQNTKPPTRRRPISSALGAMTPCTCWPARSSMRTAWSPRSCGRRSCR